MLQEGNQWGIKYYPQRREQDDGGAVPMEAGTQVEGLRGWEGPPDLIATAGCLLGRREAVTAELSAEASWDVGLPTLVTAFALQWSGPSKGLCARLCHTQWWWWLWFFVAALIPEGREGAYHFLFKAQPSTPKPNHLRGQWVPLGTLLVNRLEWTGPQRLLPGLSSLWQIGAGLLSAYLYKSIGWMEAWIPLSCAITCLLLYAQAYPAYVLEIWECCALTSHRLCCPVSCKLTLHRSLGFLLILEAGVEHYWGHKDQGLCSGST